MHFKDRYGNRVYNRRDATTIGHSIRRLETAMEKIAARKHEWPDPDQYSKDSVLSDLFTWADREICLLMRMGAFEKITK